jgi:aspartyl-tRNA(Asn)/glutamyl-tRNA(Gln) amidotransferase subunit A
MTVDVARLSVRDLGMAYRSGALSPVEALQSLAARIDQIDPQINAFAALRLNEALDESQQRTDELARNYDRGPLHGVPVAVKELFDVAGLPTRYGSEVFLGHVATVDAQVVANLKSAGAIVIGSTRSHEFAWGITSQHAVFGGVRNPYNLDRIPGGSSGGSAAAVAAGLVPLAIGTDTGGSVRIPAAFCGVAGLKATFARASTRGLMALAPSLDHVGVFAHHDHEALLCLDVMAGNDPADPRSMTKLASDRLVKTPPAARTRLGYPSDADLAGLSEDYREAFDRLLSVLSDAGIVLTQFPMRAEHARAVYGPIQMAEAFHHHAHVLRTYPTNRAAYGADVRTRLDTAAGVTLADYLDATLARQVLLRQIETDLAEVDALLTPISSGSPSLVTSPDVVEHRGHLIDLRQLVLGNTVAQNLAGMPASTIHAGTDPLGVPISFQLSAARGAEAAVTVLADLIGRLMADHGVVRQAPPLAATAGSATS